MAISLESIGILQHYLNELMNRANHHALKVDGIVLALIGGVIWRSTDEVQVKQYAGSPANILWMIVNNNRYCFAYNHGSEEIEVRDGSIKGDVMIRFSNITPVSEVKSFFENLP